MIGAKLVMPGGKMDGASIYELLDTEKVTFTAAVPTVWLMLLQHLEETGKKLPHLKKVVIGGSACPRSHHQEIPGELRRRGDPRLGHDRDVAARHAVHDEAANMPALEGDERLDIQQKQGHAPFGVEMKVTDDDDRELPMGRQDLRPAEGARPGGGARLLRRRRRASSSTRTAGSTPATSPISTRTATCRSPTAPRT